MAARAENAPADGSDLYIGYNDTVVTAPDGRSFVEWKFKHEPPFADGLFAVRFRGRVLPDLFWGRGHAWSPGSDYFTLEQYTKKKEWFLYVVRVSDGRWFRVAKDAGVDNFKYPVIDYTVYRGGENNVKRRRFVWNFLWWKWRRPRYQRVGSAERACGSK